VRLIEELLLVWPQFVARKGQPYPTVEDFKRQKSEPAKMQICRTTYKYMRRYALFAFRDKGWQKKVWHGYESVPSEKEVIKMLRER
jgi:hypothetical protein